MMSVREAVYAHELSWLSEDELVDSWDDVATQLLVTLKGRPIASGRMILQDRFETEDFLDLSTLRAEGKCAEVNRIAVLSRYRGGKIPLLLFRACYRLALREDVRFIIAMTVADHMPLYTGIGFRRIGVDVSSPNLGGTHTPMALDLNLARAQWRSSRPALLEWFQQPLDGVG